MQDFNQNLLCRFRDFILTDQLKEAKLLQDPENPDGLILELGDELCKEMGWEFGDTLEWIDNGDGSWTIQKKQTPSQ